MSNNLELKKQTVADITAKLQACKSMVVVKYSGLTVENATVLRAQCRAKQVEYCVLKNTLVRRALNDLKIEGLDGLLEGPNAFVFGMEDPVSPAKIICDFIEKNKSTALEVKAGLLDGHAIDEKTINSLAKLPSREELLAKLLGSMTNAIGGFVRVVEAYRKQKAGE